MTVAELIDALKELPQGHTVVFHDGYEDDRYEIREVLVVQPPEQGYTTADRKGYEKPPYVLVR